MDMNKMLDELRTERDQLDEAIVTLERLRSCGTSFSQVKIFQVPSS